MNTAAWLTLLVCGMVAFCASQTVGQTSCAIPTRENCVEENGNVCMRSSNVSERNLQRAVNSAARTAAADRVMAANLNNVLNFTNHQDCPHRDCVSVGWPNTNCNAYFYYYWDGEWHLILNLPEFPVTWRCWCDENCCRPKYPSGPIEGTCAARRYQPVYVIVFVPPFNWSLLQLHTFDGCECYQRQTATRESITAHRN